MTIGQTPGVILSAWITPGVWPIVTLFSSSSSARSLVRIRSMEWTALSVDVVVASGESGPMTTPASMTTTTSTISVGAVTGAKAAARAAGARASTFVSIAVGGCSARASVAACSPRVS